MQDRLLFCFLLSLLFACQRPMGSGAHSADITTIFLVRHAEKASDGTSDPDLTTAGRARAQHLANMLAPAGVSAILSTPFKRTRQTAGPLAETLGLSILEYDPKDAGLAARLSGTYRGKTILVVGHSNSTPGLVNALIGKEQFPALDESVYDRLFLVTVGRRGAKAVLLHY